LFALSSAKKTQIWVACGRRTGFDGLFKEAGPDKMKLLKGSILKGSPNMPGFQYGLEPKEVEDLIAYLKTL